MFKDTKVRKQIVELRKEFTGEFAHASTMRAILESRLDTEVRQIKEGLVEGMKYLRERIEALEKIVSKKSDTYKFGVSSIECKGSPIHSANLLDRLTALETYFRIQYESEKNVGPAYVKIKKQKSAKK